MPTWGGDVLEHRLRQTSTTTSSRPRSRPSRGTTCPTTSRTPSTSSASPRPSRSSWPASARSTTPRWSTTTSKDPREAGRDLPRHRHGLREHPELFREYFGTVIPSSDNKFAALNSAVWSGGSFIYVPPGRQGRPAAAGLLPHQRREHRPVRAHADHRRRGRTGALCRGLLSRRSTGAHRGTAKSQIEQIEKGDEVLTHKGRYRKVYNIMRRPYRGTWCIPSRYFGDSRQALRVTQEHPLLVVRRESASRPGNKEFQPEWLEGVARSSPGITWPFLFHNRKSMPLRHAPLPCPLAVGAIHQL